MTNEKIKKALEMCISSDPCDDCPYHNDGRCSDTLKTDALNLIIAQEKEFKQLETNAEILARGVRDLNHENYELTEQVKQAKIDVLNEVNRRITAIPYQIDGGDVQKEIDKMIVEVQNAENKS